MQPVEQCKQTSKVMRTRTRPLWPPDMPVGRGKAGQALPYRGIKKEYIKSSALYNV